MSYGRAMVMVEADDPADFWTTFSAMVESAATERFGTAAVGERSPDAVLVSLLDPATGTVAATAYLTDDMERNTVSWRLGHDPLNWWFVETVAASALRKTAEMLGGRAVHAEDGDTPMFDINYPTYAAWQEQTAKAALQGGLSSRLLARVMLAAYQAFPDRRRELMEIVNSPVAPVSPPAITAGPGR